MEQQSRLNVEFIEESLKENGVSYLEFCEMLGVVRAAFLKWRTGEADPSLTNLIRLRECLSDVVDYNISYDDIMADGKR